MSLRLIAELIRVSDPADTPVNGPQRASALRFAFMPGIHYSEDDSTDQRTVRANIGSETFQGEVIERGYDRTAVVYVRDLAGRVRAVRPEHPGHELTALDALTAGARGATRR